MVPESENFLKRLVAEAVSSIPTRQQELVKACLRSLWVLPDFREAVEHMGERLRKGRNP
jgi:hypothetical protein